MKIFLWNNKGKLILLLILTLCMTGLQVVSIYQVGYFFAPWENMGRPPVKVEQIIGIRTYSTYGFYGIVYVRTIDGEIYQAHLTVIPKQWIKPYEQPDGLIKSCSIKARQYWGIMETYRTQKNNVTYCDDAFFVTYQLREDGNIWRKFVDRRMRAYDNFYSNCIDLCAIPYMLIGLLLFAKKENWTKPDHQAK
jgi:hypothetical protein